MYYRIDYYRTRNWVDYKVVRSEQGATAAMNKTRLSPSSIIDVYEITVDEFEKYKKLKTERAKRRILPTREQEIVAL